MNKLILATTLLSLTFLACSSDDDPPAGSENPFPSSGGGAGGAAGTGGSDAGADADIQDSGGAAGDAVPDGDSQDAHDALSPEAGVFEITDVPAGTCSKTTAQAVKVLDPGVDTPVFDDMGSFGNRRFAYSRDSLAAVMFSLDGAEVSSTLTQVRGVAPHQNTLDVLFGDGEDLLLHAYDDSMSPEGSSIMIDSGTVSNLMAAGGGNRTFIGWVEGDTVEGTIVDRTSNAKVVFSLGAGSAGAGQRRIAAVWNGEGFAVAWSRRRSDGLYEASWATIDLLGTTSAVRTLWLDALSREVVDFERTTIGYAMVVNEGALAQNFVLLQLDDAGAPGTPSLRFLGTKYGFNVATRGSSFAVTGVMSDGQGAFRGFAADGAPLGPWVCVDDSVPNLNFAARVAIESEASGYAALVRRTNGSAWLMHFDEAGAPAL